MDFKTVIEKLLTACSEQDIYYILMGRFINHEPKPFKPMIDRVAKL